MKVAKGNHEVKLPMYIVSRYKVSIKHLHLSDTAHVNYNSYMLYKYLSLGVHFLNATGCTSTVF